MENKPNIQIGSIKKEINIAMADKTQKISFRNDPALLPLIISNIAAIFFAIIYQQSIQTIIWIYWIQSVIIGFFYLLRILVVKDFSVKDLRINGKSTSKENKIKYFLAGFFLVHYGLFHFVYFIFLFSLTFHTINQNIGDTISFILITTTLFFISHLISFIQFFLREPEINIGELMFTPYARIIPMHLIIFVGAIFGIQSLIVLISFMSLKTIADVTMHLKEKSQEQKAENI